MTTWLVVLAAAAGTYALRASMLLLLAGRDVPAPLRTALTLVGPAAIATLVALSLVPRTLEPDSITPELVAGAVAFGVVRRTGRTTDAFLVGLPVVWLLTAAGVG
jgi:branched-subunit amino acid transport protein